MKTNDLTYDQLSVLSLRCPLHVSGDFTYQDIKAGNFLFMSASNEVMRPFRKAALADLQDRRAKGCSYEGDLGHVKIGVKSFSFYPGPRAMVRDDFSRWIDANADRIVRKDGKLAESTKAFHQEDVTALPFSRHSLTAKTRAQELPEPTFDMSQDAAAMAANFSQIAGIETRRGKKTFEAFNFLLLEIQKALVDFHRRSYAKAVDHFIWTAAIALKSAECIARMHSKEQA